MIALLSIIAYIVCARPHDITDIRAERTANTLALLNRSLSARGGAVHRVLYVADRRSRHLLLIGATKRLVRVLDPWTSWSVRFWTYAPPPTFFIEVVLGDPCATSEVRGWAARNEAAAFPRIREEPLSRRLADFLHALMTRATKISFHRLAYCHTRIPNLHRKLGASTPCFYLRIRALPLARCR